MELAFVDDTKYPIEASESGDNAFYFTGCPVSSGRINYGSCLAKCKTRKSGKLGEQYSDCSALIGKRQCMAIDMRMKELAENRAIYFVSRLKLLEHNDYRLRVEREKWAHLQETGKRIRKPLDGEEETATFNPVNERGYRDAQDPLIERQPGLGTYAYREFSTEEMPDAVSVDYVYGEESSPGAYKTRADSVVLGRSAANHKPATSESNAMASVINQAVQDALQSEYEPAKETSLAQQVKSIQMLPGELPLEYAQRVSALRKGNS